MATGGRGGGYPYDQIPAGGRGGEGGYPYAQIPAGGRGEGGYPYAQIPAGGRGGGYPYAQISAGGSRGRGGGYPYAPIPVGGGGGSPYAKIPAGGRGSGGGGYPYAQISGKERQMMVEQYKDKASKFVAWLKDITNGITQKEFPANLEDMKSDLAEIDRVQNEEIPKWKEGKWEILRSYEALQNDGGKPMNIDESLGSGNIKELCIKFDSETENREARLKAEIARLESLESQLKKFNEETKHLDGRLDDIENRIGDVKKHRDTADSLQARQESDVLKRELEDVDDGVKSLVRDVKTLQEGGHSNTDQLLKILLGLQSKASQLRTLMFRNITQKPSQPSVNVMLTAQHQNASNGAQMVEMNPIFQHVQGCLQWIDTKQAALDGALYGSDINMINQVLNQQSQEHQTILDYKKEVDQCIKEREKLDKEEQEQFNEWHSKVQEAYRKLLDTSSQRCTWLQSLLDFVQRAVQALDWLQGKIEVICNCSPELDCPFGQIYQSVCQEMRNIEAHFISVEDHGRSLVLQTHPAKITIEAYISEMLSRWSLLLELLKCLDRHIQDVCMYHQFFQKVQSCEQWITQQTESVCNCMKHESLPFETVEQMKMECQDLKNALVEYEEKVAILAKTSNDIIPLKQRNHQVTSPMKVYSLCTYEHPNISLQLQEECSLLDNSQKIQWQVSNSHGQKGTVPSICLMIPPPNYEARACAERLKTQLEQLKTLVKTYDRTLTENIVELIIKFIKTWDLGQFQSLGPARCKVLLRKLNDEATRLVTEIGEVDQKIQLQLEKDLDECKRKVQEFSKKLCEEVFPCQWEKFEVRFEIDSAKDHFSSTDYAINEVSPVQMQYIADNEDERDSLMEKFKANCLRGMLQSGLFRIWVQDERDIRKMKENPNYISELKKKVISVLRSQIETHPAIQEKHLPQVVVEDIQEAQELKHLECLRASRIQIYICKSGKGVSIVGREVDKYIESVCSALEERTKNDAVCSISESVGFKRENETNGEVLTGESLKQFKKTAEMASIEGSECGKHLKLDRSTVQLLIDSDFQGELCKKIPGMAVVLLSSEVIFKGPPEALIKAEFYIEGHLKSKGYWHEVEQAASLIETSKRLNFEAYLKRKFPDVYIMFTDRKVIFIGKENMIKASEGELAKFQSAISRHCVEYKSFILNYLKFQDVQNYIWEKFESRHIECYWQVIESRIEFYCRNDEQYSAAKSALEEYIAAQKLSFESDSDLQEFEDCPDVGNLIHQSKGRLLKEMLQAGCVIYVGMTEVITQIKELYCKYMDDQKNQPQDHSSQVFLSHSLLAYVKKYLTENIREKFNVNLLELDDLSGIKISGAEDNVKNAVSEVLKILDQTEISVDSLESQKLIHTRTRQVKEIVATVEDENKTFVEIVSIPIKGKDTLRVSVGKALAVCLVYGSTPEREAEMQLIPVNDSLFPVCLAAIHIMKKGIDLQRKAERALQKFVDQNGKNPEAFKFIPDEDGGNSQHTVFFVMPDFPSIMVDFQKQFQHGLFAVFDYASKKSVASFSFPVEMHEKLPVIQMSTIIMETVNIYLDEVEQQISMKEIFLCSVEKGNQSVLKQFLESKVSAEPIIGEFINKDYFDYEDEEDSRVDMAIVTGSLLEQKVDIIVNSTTNKLALETGSLSKAILAVAGSSIQDECRQNYPNGIKFGEVAVTSAGKLNLKRIFHGALRRVDETNLHLQSLRSFMKNCLQKVKEEKCHSIAFPALGMGQLQYPVEDVAKEMFRAVTNHADQYGVKQIKFVLAESDTNVYNAFKEMENTRNSLLQSCTDCKPEYEVSLEGSGLKISIVVAKKYTRNCDVDVDLGSPTVNTPTIQYRLKFDGSREKTITVNRDTRNWSERLYLCLMSVDSLKEELLYAVEYVKHMTFTSLSVHISPITTVDIAKSAIEQVIVALDTCKSDVGDLESVMIVINDDVLQSLTPWFDENVKASQGSKSFTSKIFIYFGLKVPSTWKTFTAPCTETARTYIRITGASHTPVKTSCDTIHNRLKQLRTTEGKEAKARSSDSQSSNTSTESFDMVGMPSEGTESIASQEERNKDVEETSVLTPEKTSAQQSQMNSEDQEYPRVYLDFRAEVSEDVLNIIKDKQGVEGVKTLISDLEQIAQVETSNGKILVNCDFQEAKKVQECVFSHYKMEKMNKLNAQDIVVKHLIEGGNSDVKDLLQFAYGSKAWSWKLEDVGGKLYLLGTQSLKEEVEAVVKTLNQWCQEEFSLSSDELQKAEEAVSSVKDEFKAVFIKQTHDKIIMKGNNADSFEKAKHKMKVILGRIKITGRGRRGRNLQADEPFSSLPQDNEMETSLRSRPLPLQTSQNRAVVTSKTYQTKEGITVKVYHGDIVRLSVDCIVNAANQNLSHGGGVALAISKAAGREFDQEGEEYVKIHGPIAVTKCCVTSAGRLSYLKVIHVVGPQWHDYQHDKKDICRDDLKKTILCCLIEANRLKMSSIAIPSISSGIFGVPKPLCAQMYAQGVVEYSKIYGLKHIQEIHFVDMISEMCQLTQLAFDTELNNPSRNSPKSSGDTNQSHIMNDPSKQRHPQVSEDFVNKTQNEASNIHRSYADVVAPTDLKQLKGNKQNPYVFKLLDRISMLIYNHNITDASVDAIVCPVCPSVEGSLAKSVKKVCGPVYADNTYKNVMSTIKTEGDVVVMKPDDKVNLPFKYILHVYSPRWIRSEEREYEKRFQKRLRKSMKNIFKETRTYVLNSVAIPILGIGHGTTPFNTICEYMMDGIVDFCADYDMLSDALTAIHVVANDLALTLQLKEIASQKFGQSHEVIIKGLQSGERSVMYTEHDKESLRVTINNNNSSTFTSAASLNPIHHHSIRVHEGQKETCPICMDTPEDPVAFNMCGHVLCRQCMELTMKNKPACPVCGRAYGMIKGNQPPGTMDVKSTNTSLPGFKNCGTIEILYSFPDGTQTEGHPNPRKPYKGTRRRAFLPDNTEGRRVLSLLRKAFERHLVFTVGRSVTTGAENTVTWNDIHHKTSRDGGPQNYGYPDPDYLRRVQEELAVKGITEDT